MTKKRKTPNERITIAILIALAVTALMVVGYALFFNPAYPSAVTSPSDTVYLDNIDTFVAPEEDSETEGDYNVAVGETYCCFVNQDTAFAIISDVDGIHVQGHLFKVNSNNEWVDATPFSVTTRLFTYRLKIAGTEYKIYKKGFTLHSIVDGDWHEMSDSDDHTYRFRAVSYRQPDFATLVDNKYKDSQYVVHEVKDITYAKNYGYWTEKNWDSSSSYSKILLEGIKGTLKYQPLNLKMDLYLPFSDKLSASRSAHQRRPLILFIHGGGYYIGSKEDTAIVMWCRDFAAKGYVCASIDYRMGFFPTRDEIERTGYMAAQDANAAMRFLVSNANKYRIDTRNLFVAGCSAGAITALNLAFMTEEDRPTASYGYGYGGEKAKRLAAALEAQFSSKVDSSKQTSGEETTQVDGKMQKKAQKQKKKEEKRKQREETKKQKILEDDLGALTTSGNNIEAPFHIRAVANMWGAMKQLEELENSHTNIISFHGNADQIVPYNEGAPYQDADTKIGKRLIGNLYGSYAITNYAKNIGLKAELHTFEGKGHAPHLNADRSINRPMFDRITLSITQFFYNEMVPQPVTIAADSDNPRHFFIASQEVNRCRWHIEGGFIIALTPRDIWVVWRKEVPTHKLYVSGIYNNDIAFNAEKTID